MKKRKTCSFFEECLKNVSPKVKELVKKSMTCEHLTNGDECKLGGYCQPDLCKKWELAEWAKENKQS